MKVQSKHTPMLALTFAAVLLAAAPTASAQNPPTGNATVDNASNAARAGVGAFGNYTGVPGAGYAGQQVYDSSQRFTREISPRLQQWGRENVRPYIDRARERAREREQRRRSCGRYLTGC